MIKTPAFATKKELFDYLVANKAFNIKAKKASYKSCDAFGRSLFEKNVIDNIRKASAGTTSNDTADSIYRTIVANTYNWMDSHDDVHIPGLFTKSLQENQGNFYHLHDHVYAVSAKVGIVESMYEQQLLWTDLGVNQPGTTTTLLMDSNIQKVLNSSIFDQYSNNEINQHSVGMQYVNLFLCINDPSYKTEYASWLSYFPQIGNKASVIDQGFFYAITEAKLIETSCVLKGSNELTPMCDPDDEEEQTMDNLDQSGNTTGKIKIEPVVATQTYKHNPNLF